MPRLVDVARETMAITAAGGYTAPAGARVDLAAAVAGAVAGTYLVRQGDDVPVPPERRETVVEVTAERTGAAAGRLVDAGVGRVGVLNFANGVEPGGGFLHGSAAQEEALCRCSALFACLTADRDCVRAYYAEQDEAGTALVLDHVLVSPDVPFFRAEDLTLLERPFPATVLTAAAPDLGWLHATVDSGLEPAARFDDVPALFARRAARLLAVARAERIDALVLGAWGCGAFGNDPVVVAGAFAAALRQAPGAFARVVFAVWSREEPSASRAAFADALA